MIGNDIVDLELSRKESNWQRKGFLDKIFTKDEKILIQNSHNQEITVWTLWSRKEATYKIWNRETGIKKYNPIQFECLDLDDNFGKVQYKSQIYYTKTLVNTTFIYSLAVVNIDCFSKIIDINSSINISKKFSIPYYINDNNIIKPISKTHHGLFEKTITII